MSFKNDGVLLIVLPQTIYYYASLKDKWIPTH